MGKEKGKPRQQTVRGEYSGSDLARNPPGRHRFELPAATDQQYSNGDIGGPCAKLSQAQEREILQSQQDGGHDPQRKERDKHHQYDAERMPQRLPLRWYCPP